MATFLQPPPGGADDPMLTVPEMTALANAPRLRPASPIPWWDLPAKKAAGEQVGREELAKFGWRHHNDMADAIRHAEWSQRMASDLGPAFSGAAGLFHEAQNLWDDRAQYLGKRLGVQKYEERPDPPSLLQTLSENGMDLCNNAEGVAAAMAGRPINPSHLQSRPVIPGYR